MFVPAYSALTNSVLSLCFYNTVYISIQSNHPAQSNPTQPIQSPQTSPAHDDPPEDLDEEDEDSPDTDLPDHEPPSSDDEVTEEEDDDEETSLYPPFPLFPHHQGHLNLTAPPDPRPALQHK